MQGSTKTIHTTPSLQETRVFRRQVYEHYRKHGRNFPWRRTKNPYRILISEVMLQQTQADRVLGKYRTFLKAFPTMQVLSRASQRDVVNEWQGLGYNRRARSLHALANVVVKKYHGQLPRTKEELQTLPGIGSYTAGAIMVFAHNQPSIIIETNIRTVFLHHFFKDKKQVSDKEITPLIEATLDKKNPYEWYQALMDYGAMLKKKYGNINQKSKHYTRQSSFEGSDRQLRGKIIKVLLIDEKLTAAALAKKLEAKPKRTTELLRRLTREGFLVRNKRTFALAA